MKRDRQDPDDPEDSLVVFEDQGVGARSRTATPAPAERKAPPKRPKRSYAPDRSPMQPYQWFLAQVGLPTLVGSHRTGLPVVTWMIAVVLVLVYAFTPTLGGTDAMAFHVNDPWWMALVAPLSHGSLGHLLGNLWGLLVFGGAVEQAAPRGPYVLAFIAVGVITTLAEAMFLPAGMGVLGASGAIMAALAACLFLQPQASVTFGIFPIVLPVPMLIYMGVYTVVQVSGLLDGTGNTAWVAHVSGLLLGLALGRGANALFPDDPPGDEA